MLLINLDGQWTALLNLEEMTACKAFKACVPIEWSDKLYITLVRGMPGTRELHRWKLEMLHLHKCNRIVVWKNTPTVCGMLQQVLKLALASSTPLFILYSRIALILVTNSC